LIYTELSKVVDINPRLPKGTDENQEVSFLPMATVSEKGCVDFEEKRILKDVKKGFTYFERGDFLIAKITPCFENGKAALTCSLQHPIGYGSTEFHVIRPHKDQLDKNYLFHLLWNEKFRFLGERKMKGAAGQKRISTDFLKSHKIPLPPLNEQKRIAAILDKADALRRKREQAIALTDDLLRSTFLDMFGDPIKNTKSWRMKFLGNITKKIGSGATPKGGKKAYKQSGISLIRSLNIHDNEFRYKDLAFISDEQAHKLKNVLVEKGDVLLNITGASVCRSTMVDKASLPARVNQHVAIIRTNTEFLDPTFLLHLLISKQFKSRLLKMAGAGGATREALTKEQLLQLEIICPPIEEQIKFAVMAKFILNISENTKSSRNYIAGLASALTQSAFKGEL